MDNSPPGSAVHEILQVRYCSGLSFPSPGDFPDPKIEPRSPALQADSLPSEPPGKLYTYELEIPGDLLMPSLHITYSYPQEKRLSNPYEMVMYCPPVENFALLHLAIIDDCNKLRTQTIVNFIHAYFLLSSDAYLKAHSFVCVCFNKEQS